MFQKFRSRRLYSLVVNFCMFLVSSSGLEHLEVANEISCGSPTLQMLQDSWDTHIKIPWTAVVYLRTELYLSQTDQSIAAVVLSPTMVITGAAKFFSDGNKKLKLFAPSHYTVRTNTTIFTSDVTRHMQVSPVTHVRIFSGFSGLSKPDEWPTSAGDFALVHLQNPIHFDTEVHAVCIPTAHELNNILANWNQNGTGDVVLSGWKRNEAQGVVLRMAPNNIQTCKGFWTAENETSHAPFTHRVCANVSSNNSHTSCVHASAGFYGKLKSDQRYFYLGRVNNFYSDNRVCTPRARYFLSHVTPQILTWIDNNQKCGPNSFTCDNGQCIPLDGAICNRKSECSDSSDEDPIICRGFNYCKVDEFGCGAYGKCINVSKVCDDVIDCEEGEDEIDCKKSDSSLLIALLGTAGVVILIVAIAAIFFWKRMKLAQKKLRDLTDEEVAEFEHGLLAAAPNQQQRLFHGHNYANGPGQQETLKPEKFAWDASKYEIPKEHLIIDWENSLGSGQTGVVYRGIFEEHRGAKISNISHPVAVKTFKSSADVENFKALLAELKIMTRVGTHNNVVALVGAYTREIKQRVLFIAVELCGLGDLEGFLKKNRTAFVNTKSGDNNGAKNTTYEQNVWNDRYKNRDVLEGKQTEFNFNDLARWCYEIANGMEHLASLKITHGDLATRNVLMTNEMSAKISDFGLARNLYESGIYVKKNSAPLPWRWMAVESLRDFEFSTHSDVWAYGVTLWEIYSLGGVPFPGLGWTNEFVTQLYQGLRMSKPQYATNTIYAQMTACWELEPKRRPSFTYLKNFFQNLEIQSAANEATTQL